VNTRRPPAELVKDAVAGVIRYSGLSWLVRHTVARRRVSIVFYHAPDPATMERHLLYLAARYSFVDTDALVDAIDRRDFSALPPRPLIVTLDDGLRENRDLLELFRRFGVRPTIYLCSEIVGTTRHFWYRELDGRPVDEKERLKRLPEAERLAALEAATGFTRTREYGSGGRQALSREEIETMAPHVDFQAHTLFHPVLPMCEDRSSQEEIARSRKQLEALTGRPCRHISYPNGDYTAREIGHARDAGYASARSIDLGWNGPRTDRFALKVLGTSDDASVTRLAGELAGMRFLIHWARGDLRGRHATIRPEAG
jgi:peptidoglycan/xylan/chitin deacetylase (PgdA/CDA1 family)